MSSADSYGPIRLRPASSLFPEKLPDHYAFLTAAPGPNRRIHIHHPGYDANDDLLFTLYALDHEKGGIHYGLVLTVCAIVAGNAEDGYLSRSAKSDGERIKLGIDDVLPAGDYYFHVPHKDELPGHPKDERTLDAYRYPIVPTFQYWPFPRRIPHTFSRVAVSNRPCNTASQSSISAAVRSRDVTCRMSTHSTGTEVVHLCPEHEREWFLRNSLQRWNMDLSLDTEHVMRDMTNLTLLRRDLHLAFDDRKFVFFPKSDDGFHFHVLGPTSDIMPLYHNVQTHDLGQCSLQLLYARLAWAIFPSLSGFLSKPGTTRRLLVLTTDDRGCTIWKEIDELASEGLRAKVAASRSQSPKKRQRAAKQDDEAAGNLRGVYIPADRSEDERPKKRPMIANTARSSCSDFTDATHDLPTTPVVLDVGDEVVVSDDEQVARELAEDLDFEQQLDGLCEVERPPSFYPGYREIERIKQQWLMRNRPDGYRPS